MIFMKRTLGYRETKESGWHKLCNQLGESSLIRGPLFGGFTRVAFSHPFSNPLSLHRSMKIKTNRCMLGVFGVALTVLASVANAQITFNSPSFITSAQLGSIYSGNPSPIGITF